MQGKAAYRPRKEFEDRWHIIGTGDNPIYVCRKKEVPKLFDRSFWIIYEAWHYFHAGLGFASKDHWTDLDPNLLRGVLMLENHYNRYFSSSSVMIQYMEAIIKLLGAKK